MDNFDEVYVGPVVLEVVPTEYTKIPGDHDVRHNYDEI
ncbi:hypothetical protein SAMN05216174_104187 [Actinokineospora iranica]|uniref:Uncharacterized protein n=1 Tax=Actinokineospora iranica TaxID=1271860 RepID=A0A1G6P957_9PSEU|nr:hypothetical protein SAMN05216174_104187 [Actinokineospora iranica]